MKKQLIPENCNLPTTLNTTSRIYFFFSSRTLHSRSGLLVILFVPHFVARTLISNRISRSLCLSSLPFRAQRSGKRTRSIKKKNRNKKMKKATEEREGDTQQRQRRYAFKHQGLYLGRILIYIPLSLSLSFPLSIRLTISNPLCFSLSI